MTEIEDFKIVEDEVIPQPLKNRMTEIEDFKIVEDEVIPQPLKNRRRQKND